MDDVVCLISLISVEDSVAVATERLRDLRREAIKVAQVGPLIDGGRSARRSLWSSAVKDLEIGRVHDGSVLVRADVSGSGAMQATLLTQYSAGREGDVLEDFVPEFGAASGGAGATHFAL